YPPIALLTRQYHPTSEQVRMQKGSCDLMALKALAMFLSLLCVALVRLDANEDFPAWSPDGKKIVFMSDRDGDIGIYVANADGTHIQRLTYAPGRDAHPAFSRDGRKIAFQSPRGNREPQIYVMTVKGSDQTKLTDLPGFTGVPDWSP